MAKSQVFKNTGVPFELMDGKHVLKFNFLALSSLEDFYPNIEAAMQALENGKLQAIGTLIYVGLLHEKNGLSYEETMDIIDIREMETIGIAIRDAMEMAFGALEPVDSKLEAEKK